MGAGQDEEGTKEFDPTESKLRRLREKGSVPKSPELSQLLPFVAAVTFLLGFGDYIWELLLRMVTTLFSSVGMEALGTVGSGRILSNSGEIFVRIIFPLLAFVSISAIIGDLLQVGIMFSTEQLGPKFDKLNPTKYFKELFKVKKVIELLKQLSKVAVLTGGAYFMVTKFLERIVGLAQAGSLVIVAETLRQIILEFTIFTAIMLLLVAIIDVTYQRFNFTQENRMTRKELKDEMKQNEGDPQMKQQRRAMARRYSQGQQASLVPEADLVVTNPTKLAVAVKYTEGQMMAPAVIAKGSDAFAWQIIQIAKRHTVPVIENIPLARALFKLVSVGNSIPPVLYRAVAQLLIQVYKVKREAERDHYAPVRE